MKVQMYAVLDNLTGAFGTPFFCHSMRHAYRAFVDAYAGRGANPDDFVLYALGDYETDDAGFALQDKPVRLGTLSDVYAATNPNLKGE